MKRKLNHLCSSNVAGKLGYHKGDTSATILVDFSASVIELADSNGFGSVTRLLKTLVYISQKLNTHMAK